MNDDTQSAEPKPKQKRPWRKPRVRLMEFVITKGQGTHPSVNAYVEGLPGD